MTTTTQPEPSAANILAVFREATPEQLARGVEWYSDAHLFARALDRDNPRRAAGVIAALSPQTSWADNMRLAARAYADRFASGSLGDACGKATRILRGEDPASVLGGPKVRAFWRTIVDPTDPSAVVIDRHAVNVAVGQVLTAVDGGRLLARKGAYERFADAYREAAAYLGVAPSVVQAVTWIVWRETRTRVRKAHRAGVYG